MNLTSQAKRSEGTQLVDREVCRQVIGHFASGVTIITTRDEAVNYGLTASAVSSLSLDPPMLLVCINRQTGTSQAIAKVMHNMSNARLLCLERQQSIGCRKDVRSPTNDTCLTI